MGQPGNPTIRKWTQSDDVRAIACAVLGISAPEASQRFLLGRTPDAINMRLTHIRTQSTDVGSSEAIGSKNLLVAILKWAASHDRVPPGMSYIQMQYLCQEHGIDLGRHGLKQSERLRVVS